MQDAGILDLGLDPSYAQLAHAPERRRLPQIALIAMLLAAMLIALGAAVAMPGMLQGFGQLFGGNEKPIRISLDQQREVSAMNVVDKSQIIAEGLAAEQRNAEIPISALPVEHVAALKFGMVDGSAYATALRCLTQAVYYEAATEPLGSCSSNEVCKSSSVRRHTTRLTTWPARSYFLRRRIAATSSSLPCAGRGWHTSRRDFSTRQGRTWCLRWTAAYTRGLRKGLSTAALCHF